MLKLNVPAIFILIATTIKTYANKIIISPMNKILSEDNENIRITPATITGSVEKTLESHPSLLNLYHSDPTFYESIIGVNSINELLDITLKECKKKWGFEYLGAQLVDKKSNTIKFASVLCTQVITKDVQNLITREIWMESKESVSSYAAIKKTWIYNDIDKLLASEDIAFMDKEPLVTLGVKETLIIPILIKGESIALFNLGSMTKKQGYDTETLEQIVCFLNSLSTYIRIFKHQHVIEEHTQEQKETLKLVSKISSTINFDEIIDLLQASIKSITDYDGLIIHLYDDDTQKLKIQGIDLPLKYKPVEKPLLNFATSINEQEAIVDCFQNNHVVEIDLKDLDSQSISLKNQFIGWEIKSVKIIPLSISDLAPLGTIYVFCCDENKQITAPMIEKVRQKIIQFYNPIKNSYKYINLKKSEAAFRCAQDERSKLIKFINLVNSLNSADKIYKTISQEILKLYDFETAHIMMEQNSKLIAKASESKFDRYNSICTEWTMLMREVDYDVSKATGAYPLTFVGKKAFYFGNLDDIVDIKMSDNDEKIIGSISKIHNIKSIMNFPIINNGASIGVISLMSLSAHVELSSEDISFLELIGEFFGSAITNAGLYTTIATHKNEVERTLFELESTQKKLIDTERKRAEALLIAKETAEATAKSKSQFLANMSHEIRTPMNAVIGLTNLALRNELPAKVKSYLHKIDTSSKTLLHLINDILDFSKIESGKFTIEKTTFSLRGVLDNISDIFTPKLAENPDVDIIITADDDICDTLCGDPNRIGQIIINIVNNAIKFTNSGEVTLNIRQKGNSQKPYKLEFSISDTGIGIKDDVIGSLFDSFTQADGSISRKYGGTGLGLTICKSLVELMGGRIWVESEIGKGSTFYFIIKLDKVESKSSVNIHIPDIIRNKKILVVDDNRNLRTELCNTLKSYGLSADAVSSGSEAINRLNAAHSSQQPYQLAIIDIHMPVMDGVQTAQNIYLDDKFNNLPIISLGTLGQEEAINNINNIAAIVYKPVKPIELIESVLTVLDAENEIINEIESSINTEDDLEQIAKEKLNGNKVLVIDDNNLNLQVAGELMQIIGIDVDTSASATEGIEKIRENEYSLVFMDIQMPELNGYDAAEIIRKDPNIKNNIVIAMTANAMDGDKSSCLRAGMDDYIPKPINTTSLYKLLLKWLDKDSDKQNAIQELSSPLERIKIRANAIKQENQIDFNLAIQKLGNNKSLFVKLVDDFCTSFVGHPQQISAAIKDNNIELAHRLAHTVKGVSGTFGANFLYDSSLLLETMLKRGETENLELTQSMFKKDFENCHAQLNTFLKSIK